MKTAHTTSWFGGFGFGVWRTRDTYNTVIWTFAFGPVTLFLRIWGRKAKQ